MPDKGTRNAIFVLRRMSERAILKQKYINARFFDYSKAFDTVRHEPLINLLKAMDMDSHDVQLLANLYWKQKAAVRYNGQIIEWMSIKQSVRQGCLAQCTLTEMIMMSPEDWLQTTQPTSGEAVTVVSSCCVNCVEPPRPQQWGPDLPFFGHADPLDGWRCCSQKRVMSRPIQVRQL